MNFWFRSIKKDKKTLMSNLQISKFHVYSPSLVGI